MSTGNAALAALCLCLAAGEASGNAITVLTSRVVRHPEVPCALDLIPPLFQRADNDSATYAPRLCVFGNADWLDEFLRRLPNVASIFVFTVTEVNEGKFEDALTVELMPSTSIALQVFDSEDRTLSIPRRVRYIFWLSVDSNNDADYVISERVAPPDHCFSFFRMMVTARPRGTTHVLSVPMPCDLDNASSPPKSELLGVWSPGAGWSAPDVPLFPPLCASWRPPPDGEPLLAEMFEFTIGDTPTVDNYIETEAYEVLRLLRDSYGLEFKTEVNYTTKSMMPYRRADTCRLDLVAIPASPAIINAKKHAELSFFPWDESYLICLVPVGAGKPRPLLYPLTAEYTPEVWAALAAVVLAVVASLYLMGRDESVQELVLQTLSPLLGQPLDDRQPGPHIALLGGWLLTCVVLIGGYQGQLLGFITVPLKNREINSWEDWLESDLVLMGENKYMTASSANVLGLYGLTEERIDRETSPMIDALLYVGAHRNASYLINKHRYEVVLRNMASEQPEDYKSLLSKIHTFVPPVTPRPQSSFLTTKGSPFKVPLRKILGRIRAAGGLFRDWNYKNHLPQDRENEPISLLNTKPIIMAYIAGNILAVFTFLLEFILPALRKFGWPRYSTKSKLKPPRPYLP